MKNIVSNILVSIVIIIQVFISSVAQILLKKSAMKEYKNHLQEYFNPLVIIGYSLFLLCTVGSLVCYRFIPLSYGTVLETVGYIFVPILSFIFLKEKLTIRQVAGIAIIITGILLFTMSGNMEK